MVPTRKFQALSITLSLVAVFLFSGYALQLRPFFGAQLRCDSLAYAMYHGVSSEYLPPQVERTQPTVHLLSWPLFSPGGLPFPEIDHGFRETAVSPVLVSLHSCPVSSILDRICKLQF